MKIKFRTCGSRFPIRRLKIRDSVFGYKLTRRRIYHSRPLRINFERDWGREGLQECVQDQTQKNPRPGEDEAKVVADRCEDGVGGIAFTTFEIAARGDLRPSGGRSPRIRPAIISITVLHILQLLAALYIGYRRFRQPPVTLY